MKIKLGDRSQFYGEEADAAIDPLRSFLVPLSEIGPLSYQSDEKMGTSRYVPLVFEKRQRRYRR